MKFTSFLSTALVTLSLGVEYISAQTPFVPGVYQFASTVTDFNGNRLALTDQGQNQAIVLTPLNFGQANQLWNVTASPTGDGVFVVFAPSSTTGNPLQVGSAGNLPGPLSTVAVPLSQSFIWRSQFNSTLGFTFLDTLAKGTNWGVLTTARNGSVLNAVAVSPTPFNAWVPIRVS